jgi:hypothetical protein
MSADSASIIFYFYNYKNKNKNKIQFIPPQTYWGVILDRTGGFKR